MYVQMLAQYLVVATNNRFKYDKHSVVFRYQKVSWKRTMLGLSHK